MTMDDPKLFSQAFHFFYIRFPIRAVQEVSAMSAMLYYALKEKAFELLKVPNSRHVWYPFFHHNMWCGSVLRFSKRKDCGG